MSLIVNIEKKLDHMMLRADFSVDQEVMSLFGISGSGKSMILKCIAGLETPDKGRIVLNGRVLFDSEKNINVKPGKRRTGYVFQNYALFPNMTVSQNIGLAVEKTNRKQIVAEAIKKFRLEGLEDVRPAKLSGGQKQRVSIARMYAARPELVLLDEPFSALDYQLVRELIHEMRAFLEKASCPVIFVSHNREEVYQLSSRVGVIEKGSLGCVRPTKEVFAKPKTMEEAKLCGCDNIIRLTDQVKKWLSIDTCIEKITAVGIYSHEIFLNSQSEGEISLSGTIIKITEEINRVCYEVLLEQETQCTLTVSIQNTIDIGKELLGVGANVKLALKRESVHFLTDGGRE